MSRHLKFLTMMILRSPEAPGSSPTPAASPEPAAPTDGELQLPAGNTEDVFDDDNGGDDVDLSSLFDAKPAAPAAPASSEPALASAGGAAQPAAGAIPSPAPVATPPAAQPPAPAAPAATPAAAPAAAPQAQEPPAPTVEQIAQQYNERRAEQVQRLAAETFRLTDEQAQALETNPRETVPLLMAQSTMAAIEATTVAVANMLPAVVQRLQESLQTQNESVNSFVKAWPALKDHVKDPRAVQVAQLYRQMNPSASAEEFIAAVGPIVHMTLGIPVEQQQAPAATPAAPRPRPHTPPLGGAPARAATPNGHDNIFTAMASEDLADDV